MIVAELFFRDKYIGQVVLRDDYPPETIRELSHEPLDILVSYERNGIEAAPDISMGTWIYRYKERTGPFSARYDLIGSQSSVGFAKPFGPTMDFGFREPDENVNLGKLIERLRDNKIMKELLIKYYASP